MNVSEPPTLECVILIGLPGAGKTTFYRQQFAETHRHISNDLRPKVSSRRAQLQRELQEAFQAGQSVVVDNVNATAADRAFLISLARSHSARVVGYYFAVSTRQAVARNAQRTGRARVANVAIFTAAKRLEIPRRDEGFDELSTIDSARDVES